MSDYEKLKPALQKLVDDGTLSAAQALAAQTALRTTSGSEVSRSRRSLFSEALTYIGGAVIVVSAGLLLSQAWDQLGTWGRPAVIGAAAVVLFIAGMLLSRNAAVDTLRRLCSTLFVGAAALAAFTIGLITSEIWIPQNDPNAAYWINPKPWVYMTIALLCALGGGLVALAGYFRAKSALGVIAQLFAADVAVFALGALVWIKFYGDDDFPSYGSLALIILGAAWIYVAEKELIAETNSVAIGAILTLGFAVQSFRDLLADWAIPTGMIAGGLMFLALYLYGRKWPWLAGGIGGMLFGGIELLTRYVEGIGGALGSMALGVALLILGTRLFKEHK